MNKQVTFNGSDIAPCGLNCGTCMAYLRTKNRCFGCRTDFDGKRKTCLECKIKNCQFLQKTISGFCFECKIFPCDKIKHIDRRYRTKYHARLIENLLSIKENGMSGFLIDEAKKWTCPKCSATLSVHRDNCLNCNYKLKNIGARS